MRKAFASITVAAIASMVGGHASVAMAATDSGRYCNVIVDDTGLLFPDSPSSQWPPYRCEWFGYGPAHTSTRRCTTVPVVSRSEASASGDENGNADLAGSASGPASCVEGQVIWSDLLIPRSFLNSRSSIEVIAALKYLQSLAGRAGTTAKVTVAHVHHRGDSCASAGTFPLTDTNASTATVTAVANCSNLASDDLVVSVSIVSTATGDLGQTSSYQGQFSLDNLLAD